MNIAELTLFGSGIGFGIAVVITLALLIIADINESIISGLVCLGVFLGFNYFWGTFSLGDVLSWRSVGIYVLIGFCYSVVRTYFKGKNMSNYEKRYFNLQEHVFRWWFLFPISMITWLFGDLLVDLWNFIYRKVEKMYLSVFGFDKDYESSTTKDTAK